MMISAAASIEIHKQQLNELNVFPVPDGDTGTNMSMTLSAAANDLRKLSAPTLTAAADAAASAMLRGARGNSGVILSLLLRGFAKTLKGMDACDGAQFAFALKGGVEAAYKAVMKPAEGTILTVARVAAQEAEAAAESDPSFEAVIEAAAAASKVALAQTVNQNPVLQKAGVVDAGGKGWMYVLEAMLSVTKGVEIEAPDVMDTAVREQADFSDFNTADITFGYCTEFIVSRENGKAPEALRSFLNGLGDSLVLVDDDEIIKVHVHTNNPGTVLEEAITYGGLVTVKIENMKLQHTEKVMKQEEAPAIAPAQKHYGMVAVCAGAGLSNVFRELGADNMVAGGQTMNPSTQDILEKINATPAEVVFVFPNNKNIIMAAEQTIPLTEKKVIVIPSKTVPQGVSAMLQFDPEAQEQDNIEAMHAAMEQVTTMQVTYAARNSDFDGHSIREGEYLALYGGSLFGSSGDLPGLMQGLADKVKEEGGEFITVYYGQDVSESDAAQVVDIFSKTCPDAEVTLIDGGQPVYYYLISAE
ncbi:MAG: DAK2 domain-containing protein [Oscillospiraceae bacterium]|jgi:DAK2 domain fusion protein YloV|nr:DAK2 domain-containing protein [Oscillospiraceae bacterium]